MWPGRSALKKKRAGRGFRCSDRGRRSGDSTSVDGKLRMRETREKKTEIRR